MSQTTWACAEKTPVTPATSSHLCLLFSFTTKPGPSNIIESKSRQTQKKWTIEGMKLAWNILKATMMDCQISILIIEP